MCVACGVWRVMRVGCSPACCAPEDMADLVEYCWGNGTTTWGQQRIQDGHADPYQLQYIELGNEQYNSLFVDQVSLIMRMLLS